LAPPAAASAERWRSLPSSSSWTIEAFSVSRATDLLFREAATVDLVDRGDGVALLDVHPGERRVVPNLVDERVAARRPADENRVTDDDTERARRCDHLNPVDIIVIIDHDLLHRSGGETRTRGV
jgi:hypothetical protein